MADLHDMVPDSIEQISAWYEDRDTERCKSEENYDGFLQETQRTPEEMAMVFNGVSAHFLSVPGSFADLLRTKASFREHGGVVDEILTLQTTHIIGETYEGVQAHFSNNPHWNELEIVGKIVSARWIEACLILQAKQWETPYELKDTLWRNVIRIDMYHKASDDLPLGPCPFTFDGKWTYNPTPNTCMGPWDYHP